MKLSPFASAEETPRPTPPTRPLVSPRSFLAWDGAIGVGVSSPVIVSKTRATIEVYPFLAFFVSLPQNGRKHAFFFSSRDSRCVPKPWDFSSGSSYLVCFFLQNQFFWERS